VVRRTAAVMWWEEQLLRWVKSDLLWWEGHLLWREEQRRGKMNICFCGEKSSCCDEKSSCDGERRLICCGEKSSYCDENNRAVVRRTAAVVRRAQLLCWEEQLLWCELWLYLVIWWAAGKKSNHPQENRWRHTWLIGYSNSFLNDTWYCHHFHFWKPWIYIFIFT